MTPTPKPAARLADWPERDLPLLAPWWRVVHDGERILFEHAGRVVELRGRAVQMLLPALLPLLDGAHTPGEIVGRLGEAAEPSVRKALALLESHGLLTDGPNVEDDAVSHYVATACAGATPSSAHEALSGSRVAVCGTSLAAAEVARLLERSKIRVAWVESAGELGSGVDLVVAAPAPAELGGLREANERRLRDGVPWLPVSPYDGRLTAVGPLYVPGQTACHACFLLRRGATSGYEEDVSLLESRPPAAPLPDAVGTLAAAIAALVSLRWLAAKDPTLPGVAFAFEASGILTLTRHRVLRVPRCTACGPPGPPPNPWFKELGAGDARQPVHAGR